MKSQIYRKDKLERGCYLHFLQKFTTGFLHSNPRDEMENPQLSGGLLLLCALQNFLLSTFGVIKEKGFNSLSKDEPFPTPLPTSTFEITCKSLLQAGYWALCPLWGRVPTLSSAQAEVSSPQLHVKTIRQHFRGPMARLSHFPRHLLSSHLSLHLMERIRVFESESQSWLSWAAKWLQYSEFFIFLMIMAVLISNSKVACSHGWQVTVISWELSQGV